MLPVRDPVQIALPVAAPPPPRPGFPFVATFAPLAVSVLVWAVTQSPLALVFALLGPVIAISGVLDGARRTRRATRRDAERLTAELARVTEQIREAQGAERERLARPTAHWGADARSPLPVWIATGAASSGIELTGDRSHAAESEQLAALRADAATLVGAPLVVDARGGIVIVGVHLLGRAVARSVAVQLGTQLSPSAVLVRVPPTESWATDLPHATETGAEDEFRFESHDGDAVVVRWSATDPAIPVGSVVLRLPSGAPAELETGTIRTAAVRPLALGAVEAHAAAARIRGFAETHGIRSPRHGIPRHVSLAQVISEGPTDPGDGLVASIGCGGDGVVSLDLVTQGPHAVVAGTTGSGKSELLVSWVLAMASDRSPAEVAFVLVDFKGGAAFAPLADLPHVLGTLSDLDPRLARRAIESLRAELLRRERVLADARCRSIGELRPGTLPRLVIVVDEFAAVVADHPELHQVFADLAARGRSLGMHLVLCTQRPAGVIRDAVLANVPLRISLRVADRADSIAMIGSDAAVRLPVHPPGRALLADGTGPAREFQVALTTTDDANLAGPARAPAPGVRPWCDPLPAVLRPGDLIDRDPEPPPSGIPFGLVDLPAEQRQPVARYDPLRHGHLMLLGAPRSGKTTALETLAAADPQARWLPNEPAALWDFLSEEARGPEALLLLDDLDLVIARCDPDHRAELIDILARRVREGGERGAFVVTAHRLGGGLSALAANFESRLILRQSSREDHVIAGAPPAEFDARLPPGSGWWRGAVVQVAIAPAAVPHAVVAQRPVVVVRPDPARELAVVAPRVGDLRERLVAAGARVVLVGDDDSQAAGLRTRASDDPTVATVLLGDPDAWQADWALLTRVRRDLPMLLDGCSLADHRALTRSRELPPPLDRAAGDCWLVDGGRTRRARLDLASG